MQGSTRYLGDCHDYEQDDDCHHCIVPTYPARATKEGEFSLRILCLYLCHEVDSLLVDQEGDAAVLATGRVAGAGGVDDETAGWVRALLVVLIAFENQ